MDSKKLKFDCREETGDRQETNIENWNGLPQEVLIIIFNHLPVPDLLSSSVVSKNWKKSSRDVLKRSRECYIYIKHFREDVQGLNDMIASTDLMQMINGLHIQIRPRNNSGRDAPSSSWPKDSNAKDVLKLKKIEMSEIAKRKLQAVLYGQWKYLNLDIGNRQKEVLSIEDAFLLRELISATSKSIQKLVVAQDTDCSLLSGCGKNFSKLKVIHVLDEKYGRKLYLERFVLKFAQNLEEITGAMLHVKVHAPGHPFMLKRMKSILVIPDVVVPEAGLMEGFRSVSGLHRLDLQRSHCMNSDDATVLYSMVLNSLDTLEELRMCILEFYDLCKTSDDLKLPDIRRLSLTTHWHIPIEVSALRLLNLPTLCPNLEHLELSEAEGEMKKQEKVSFEGPYSVDQSNVPLQIEWKCAGGLYHHEHLKFLSQIYPKINKLKVLKWRPVEDSNMNRIFSDVQSLEHLEINVFLRDSFYDPDVAVAAILCGINIEEAKFLHSGLPRSNAELNPYTVPIYPSLFNAKNLKELKITGEGNYSGAFVNHSWIINVIENLPVRHVRKLKVNFEGREGLYKELNDLRALTTLLCAQVEKN